MGARPATLRSGETLLANDPNLPPFPWCPTCDSRSGETLLANDPNLPPFPSCDLRPAEAERDVVATDDPNLPPFPWCPTCDSRRLPGRPRARTSADERLLDSAPIREPGA